MIRITSSLILIFQLLVPARAELWLLTAIVPAPSHDESVAAVAAKTCPCSGAAICKCGSSCCSDSSEEKTENGPSTAVPRKDQKNQSPDEKSPTQKGNSGELRCRCTSPDSLTPAVDYFSHAPQSGLVLIASPQADLLGSCAASWASVFPPVDLPPPRNL
jgi:hypothetical protein